MNYKTGQLTKQVTNRLCDAVFYVTVAPRSARTSAFTLSSILRSTPRTNHNVLTKALHKLLFLPYVSRATLTSSIWVSIKL